MQTVKAKLDAWKFPTEYPEFRFFTLCLHFDALEKPAEDFSLVIPLGSDAADEADEAEEEEAAGEEEAQGAALTLAGIQKKGPMICVFRNLGKQIEENR